MAVSIISNPLAFKNQASPIGALTSPLLCRKNAARYLGVAPQTLAQWHCSQRVSLPILKLGRKVAYRKADLDAFIAANMHGVITVDQMEAARG